jgi:hypothetical protein
MIFVPKLKIIEPKSEIVSRSGLKGEWRLVATNRYTGRERVLADWFPNLILDGGLNRIGLGSGWLGWCYVGTGNSTPTETQSSLDNQIASTSTRTAHSTSSSGAAPWYAQNTITYRFAQGAAAGNISEIGVGWSAGLFSRALILDGLGDPTTITVLADEFLDATYRVRVYPPAADVTTSMSIDGVETEVLARAANASSQFSWFGTSAVGPQGGGDPTGSANRHNCYAGLIGPITGAPSNVLTGTPGAANAAYVSGSYQVDYSTTWGLTLANTGGGVRSYRTDFGRPTGNFGSMQYQFTPTIAKDATKTMVLNARHIWGRYIP